jgi:hypothetical protein
VNRLDEERGESSPASPLAKERCVARATSRIQLWDSRPLASDLSLAQGAYYTATGLWPLFSLKSFERITGPKADRWLVKTVGTLVSAIGAALLVAGIRRRAGPEIATLAAGAAAGLAAVETVYALRGRISKVYLLDALGELALVGGWTLAAARGL